MFGKDEDQDTSFEEFVFERMMEYYVRHIDPVARMSFAAEVEKYLDGHGDFAIEDIDIAIGNAAKRLGYE